MTIPKQQGGVQLPDDAISVGYKEIRPFHPEQIFYSPSNDFKGTEQEFIDADLAYRYHQDGFKRHVEP